MQDIEKVVRTQFEKVTFEERYDKSRKFHLKVWQCCWCYDISMVIWSFMCCPLSMGISLCNLGYYELGGKYPICCAVPKTTPYYEDISEDCVFCSCFLSPSEISTDGIKKEKDEDAS